ncbi:BRO family protein [Arsenophonus endosymbiont of Apis mellifera]|uniref:BRO family protein n=1 Tax=Arsenophonus endosymbiont of Apis mellifera TaxID=1541805 RepID=UPI0015D77799
MANLSLTPFIFENQQIRTLIKNGIPWFVAQDICNALQITNSRQAIATLDDDEKGVTLSDTLGGKQKVNIINESGMYTLMLRSRDAIKKGSISHRLRKWVTSEVIPSIRKTGSYSHNKNPNQIEFICPECGSKANIIESQYRHRCLTECYIKCTNKHCLTAALLDIQLRQILTYPNKDKVKKTIMSMSKMDRAIALDMLMS